VGTEACRVVACASLEPDKAADDHGKHKPQRCGSYIDIVENIR
jgi:hypothetical protein